MPLSPHVSRKLQDAVGVEAGEELVTWMSNVDDLRADVAELRHEMEQRFTALEYRMDQRFVAQESRMEQGFARMEALMERRASDLIKWSFVFWVSAVGAIAALAGILK
jgi:hypothetical protein